MHTHINSCMQDGELYNPPDQKVFKPFFMKQKAGRKVQLYDVDGPSPRDLPVCVFARLLFFYHDFASVHARSNPETKSHKHMHTHAYL
jgi:hypothetical protein